MSDDTEAAQGTTRSEGAQLTAQGNIDIGGSVVGRDEIISAGGDVIGPHGSKSVTVIHHNRGAVLVALVAVVAMLGAVIALVTYPAKQAVQSPALPIRITNSPTPVTCLATPIAVPTSLPGTGPLSIESSSTVCTEVRQLASQLAGNTVQLMQQAALNGVDEAELTGLFSGQALEQVAQLYALTVAATTQTHSQNMIYTVEPRSSKITHLTVVDPQSIRVEICIIVRGVDRTASQLATPDYQFALLEVLYQQIGSTWYAIRFPRISAPPIC